MQLPTAPNATPARVEVTAEEAAAMLDALAAADVCLTIAGLEHLLAALRPAAEIRRQLASVPANTLQAALRIRARRSTGPAADRLA